MGYEADMDNLDEPLTVREILDGYAGRVLEIEKDDSRFFIDGKRKVIGGRFKVNKARK